VVSLEIHEVQEVCQELTHPVCRNLNGMVQMLLGIHLDRSATPLHRMYHLLRHLANTIKF
jgi:hypothetical protein